MNVYKVIVASLIMVLVTISTGFCADPTLADASPGIIITAGDEVILTGDHFDPDTAMVAIEKIGKDNKPEGKPVAVKPEKIEPKSLKFKMPSLEGGSAKINISVANFGSKKTKGLLRDYYFKEKSGLTVTDVAPKIVSSDDEVTVTGEGFDTKTAMVAITVLDKDGKSKGDIVQVKPTKTENTSLTFKMPKLEGVSTKISISVVNFGKPQSNGVEISIYASSVDPYIQSAVKWKKAGMPDTVILDHLSKKIEDDIRSGAAKPYLFTGVKISDADLSILKDAGFDSDFISTLEGQSSQYVTLGMAAIFLPDGGKVTTAPMLRVFLTPKSYFRPRFPLLTVQQQVQDWLVGILETIDFNLGFTVISTKTETSESSTNYLLSGISYEMNRGALFNLGAAFPVNGEEKKKTTYYVGVTLDQNLLKAIGLMK